MVLCNCESEVAKVWIVVVVMNLKEENVLLWLLLHLYSFGWSGVGGIVLNVVRIVWNVLEFGLNDFGLVFDYASIGVGLIVCS